MIIKFVDISVFFIFSITPPPHLFQIPLEYSLSPVLSYVKYTKAKDSKAEDLRCSSAIKTSRFSALKPAGANSESGVGIPFENLFPSLKQIPGLSQGIPGLTSSVPAVDAITKNIPGLEGLPDLKSLIGLNRNLKSGTPGGQPTDALGEWKS